VWGICDPLCCSAVDVRGQKENKFCCLVKLCMGHAGTSHVDGGGAVLRPICLGAFWENQILWQTTDLYENIQCLLKSIYFY